MFAEALAEGHFISENREAARSPEAADSGVLEFPFAFSADIRAFGEAEDVLGIDPLGLHNSRYCQGTEDTEQLKQRGHASS